MSHFYIVDRMLAEFAAAAVVFAKATYEDNRQGRGEEWIVFSSKFVENIEGILQASHPNVFPYYLRCLDRCHKDFVWTGPQVEILPRSQEFISVISLLTAGELLDFPGHEIYTAYLDPSNPNDIPQFGKRHSRGEDVDLADEQPKKRKRQT